MKQPVNIATLATDLLSRENKEVFTSKEIFDYCRENSFSFKIVTDALANAKVGRGRYNLTAIGCSPRQISVPQPSVPTQQIFQPAQHQPQPQIKTSVSDEVHIPLKDPNFVKWGSYDTVHAVISSRMFFPLYISGMSGNGKTIMVEQACAHLQREYVRVQITPESDEDDLIGGFRLIDGETVFHKGPVIKAMESGAILLIDEIDRGSNKIMCLQSVMEGKPVLIKKIGEIVSPAPGFNVLATANTSGRGSTDGRYSAANIIDEAFIERFSAAINQEYAPIAVERNIVKKHMASCGVNDTEFCEKLVAWSDIIRKTYESDGVDEVVSTRRLCHIVKAYAILRDRLAAIRMCTSRFEPDTHEAFLDLYTKVDASVSQPPAESQVAPEEQHEEDGVTA